MTEEPVEELNNITPAFFEMLSESDQKGYITLRNEIAASDTKFKRYKRITSLQEALYAIRTYCVRNDKDDWRRFLVCGICWIGWDIAINTRQLRLLINKCKSSINGAIAKMGYSTAPIKGEGFSALINVIPFLKGNFVEQRMWTVRKRQIGSPAPSRNFGFNSPILTTLTNYPSRSPQPFLTGIPRMPVSTNELTAVFGIPDLTPSHSPYSPPAPAQNDVFDGGISNPSSNMCQIGTPQLSAAPTPTPQIQSNSNTTISYGSQPNDSERHVQIIEPKKECTYNIKNIYQDVCTCCPLDWLLDDDEDEKEDFLTFG